MKSLLMLAKFTNCVYLQTQLTLISVLALAIQKGYVLLKNSAVLRRLKCGNVNEEKHSTFPRVFI